MKSGILSFNAGLFWQHIRSVVWIGAFLLLAELVMLPMGMMVVLQDEWRVQELFSREQTISILFEIAWVPQLLALSVFSVLAGIVLTNYAANKRAADFMHSLPFTRRTLLTHVYIAGAAVLGLPVVAVALFTGLIEPAVDPIAYTWLEIGEWTVLSLLVVWLLFTVTVLIGLLIGPALLQGVMAYGVFVLPAMLVWLLMNNARYFVNGIASEAYTSKLWSDGFFFARVGMYPQEPFSLMEWLLYSGLFLLVMVLSYWLYKKRPAEAADETIVFPLLRRVFVFVFTLLAMLLGGLYFAEMLAGTIGWMVTGYVIGLLVGYTVLQMIVQKALRLVWPWKDFALFIATFAVLLVPAFVWAQSYEQAVPEQDQIDSVYAGMSVEPFQHEFYDDEQRKWVRSNPGFLTGAESIAQVQALHETLADSAIERDRSSLSPVYLTYKMKDGSLIRRHYNVDMDRLHDLTEPLRANQEFIKESSTLFVLKDNAPISLLTVYNNIAGIQLPNQSDPETVAAILTAVKQDKLSGSAATFSTGDASSIGSVDVMVGRRANMVNVYENITLRDERTIAAIRKLVPNAENFATAEQVTEAYIVNAEDPAVMQKLQDFLWMSDELPDLADMPFDYKEITNRDEIRTLMAPSSLAEKSDQLLVLKWDETAAQYPTVSIVPVKSGR